jgi:hypothetical protein
LPAFGRPNDADAHLGQTGNAEGARGNLRNIDYSSVDGGAAIGNAHHRRVPVFLILDVDQRPEWQCPMRGGEILRKSVFSARRLFACG